MFFRFSVGRLLIHWRRAGLLLGGTHTHTRLSGQQQHHEFPSQMRSPVPRKEQPRAFLSKGQTHIDLVAEENLRALVESKLKSQ